MIRNLLFISIIAFSFLSCEKENPPDLDWKEGVIYFTGDIAVDGCGWLLLFEGQSYHVSNLPEEMQIDGLDVWFKAKDLNDTFSCGLSQTKFDVKEIEEMVEKPWEVRFLDDYPERETSFDMFSLDSAYIANDSLYLQVGYSGGCRNHQFNLWAMETGEHGKGDLHLMLEHISNGDECEAYLTEWLQFSLAPLQKLHKNEVSFWLRGSPIMSSLFGFYTYTY